MPHEPLIASLNRECADGPASRCVKIGVWYYPSQRGMNYASNFGGRVRRFISFYHCNSVGIRCGSGYAGESATNCGSASTGLHMALDCSWFGRSRGGDSVRSRFLRAPPWWAAAAVDYGRKYRQRHPRSLISRQIPARPAPQADRQNSPLVCVASRRQKGLITARCAAS